MNRLILWTINWQQMHADIDVVMEWRFCDFNKLLCSSCNIYWFILVIVYQVLIQINTEWQCLSLFFKPCIWFCFFQNGYVKLCTWTAGLPNRHRLSMTKHIFWELSPKLENWIHNLAVIPWLSLLLHPKYFTHAFKNTGASHGLLNGVCISGNYFCLHYYHQPYLLSSWNYFCLYNYYHQPYLLNSWNYFCLYNYYHQPYLLSSWNYNTIKPSYVIV